MKTLIWTASPGAEYYRLYRDGEFIDNTKSQQYRIDSTLATRVWSVTAIGANGIESAPCTIGLLLDIQRRDDGQPFVSWPARVGQWYALEFSTDGGKSWIPQGSYTPEPDGSTAVDVGSEDVKSAMFRVMWE